MNDLVTAFTQEFVFDVYDGIPQETLDMIGHGRVAMELWDASGCDVRWDSQL
jgi:hypothetical protein